MSEGVERGGGAHWRAQPSSDRLARGAPRPPRPPLPSSRVDAIVEVLHNSLRESRRSVVELEAVGKAVAAALDREKKQFERLQFVLKKASDDAAYLKGQRKLRDRDRALLARYRTAHGELETEE